MASNEENPTGPTELDLVPCAKCPSDGKIQQRNKAFNTNMAPENPVDLTWYHVCAKCPVSRRNLRLLKTSSSSDSINHKYYFAYSTLVLGQLAKTYAMTRRNVGILTTDISWKDEWLRFRVMRNEERYDNKVSTVPFAKHIQYSCFFF